VQVTKDLEMYTRDFCIYCYKAKEVIKNNPDMGFRVTEYNVDTQKAYMDTLKERFPDVKTVPQIWIAGKHIGGYEDLVDYIDETTSLG
jgi:glutaredoxin 3